MTETMCPASNALVQRRTFINFLSYKKCSNFSLTFQYGLPVKTRKSIKCQTSMVACSLRIHWWIRFSIIFINASYSISPPLVAPSWKRSIICVMNFGKPLYRLCIPRASICWLYVCMVKRVRIYSIFVGHTKLLKPE